MALSYKVYNKKGEVVFKKKNIEGMSVKFLTKMVEIFYPVSLGYQIVIKRK